MKHLLPFIIIFTRLYTVSLYPTTLEQLVKQPQTQQQLQTHKIPQELFLQTFENAYKAIQNHNKRYPRFPFERFRTFDSFMMQEVATDDWSKQSRQQFLKDVFDIARNSLQKNVGPTSPEGERSYLAMLDKAAEILTLSGTFDEIRYYYSNRPRKNFVVYQDQETIIIMTVYHENNQLARVEYNLIDYHIHGANPYATTYHAPIINVGYAVHHRDNPASNSSFATHIFH